MKNEKLIKREVQLIDMSDKTICEDTVFEKWLNRHELIGPVVLTLFYVAVGLLPFWVLIAVFWGK